MVATLARFSIVVVPFPYADQLAEKRRPALVISNENRDRQNNLIWVAMITSAKNQSWQDDIDIADFASCGLPAPSTIRPVKIATIDVGRVLGILGQISHAERDSVLRFYRQEFG